MADEQVLQKWADINQACLAVVCEARMRLLISDAPVPPDDAAAAPAR